jgi:hypothetical protein
VKATSETTNETTKVSSCVTAVAMALTTIIRGVNIGFAEGAKSKAQEEIDKLAAGGGVVGGSQIPDTNRGNFNQNFGSGGGGSGGSTTGAGGGGGGGGGATDSPTIDPENPLGNSSFASAGKDSNALRQSGLDKIAAPKANELLKNGLIDQLKKSGAAAALAANLPADSGSFGEGIAALGRAAESDKDFLKQAAADLGITAAVGGMGGGAGGGGGGGASNPFAGLLGGAQTGKADAQASGLKFGNGPAPQKLDIYHTGSPLSIFEIVSGKIETVRDRVQNTKAPAAVQKPAAATKKN